MRSILRDETGTTAIEYALLASLIAIAMLVGLRLVGTSNTTSLTNTANTVSEATK